MQLRVTNLRVSSALQELTLTLSPGALTGLIGPNGAGKTTLLRCLAGDIPPDSGEVHLDNQPLQRWRASERAQKIAYLPQSTPTVFPFTVRELVGLREASPEACQAALETLDLAPLAERPLTTLSGGEQRRAALARVLAQQAPCLLLDEPLTYLDPKYQLRLLEYLQQHCRQGGSAMIVLHELRLARQWCSELVLLAQGTRVAQGTPEQVLTENTLHEVFHIPASFLA